MSTEEWQWIKQNYFYHKNPTFLDVGAHNFHDSIFLKHHMPYSNVYAFEPDPKNLSLYKDSAVQYGINVIEKALSNECGAFTFYPASNEASGSLLFPTVKEDSNESTTHENLCFNLSGINVETLTLDKFCEDYNIENIDHMHIDVQGAEYQVIQSIKDTCKPKSIFAETCEFETYKTGLTLEDFDNLMFEKGYIIVQRLIYDTLYKLK